MPTINLDGPMGNAFAIIGFVRTTLRQVKVDQATIDAYMAEATKADYTHLLEVSVRVCKENGLNLVFESAEDPDYDFDDEDDDDWDDDGDDDDDWDDDDDFDGVAV